MTRLKQTDSGRGGGNLGQRRLTITYRDPATVKPDPGNARTHSKKQFGQIAASMGEVDFVNPILADEDGVIIAGHGRLLAAKSLGMAKIPVIEIAGLSDAQKRALRLADNKIALNAGWDTDLLRVELESLANMKVSFDLGLTGFSTGEIDVVLSDKPSGDPDDEIVPMVPARPVTRSGDIWVLRDHRVMCGDCRERPTIDKLMNGAKADVAFLDVPYNIVIDGNAVGKGRHKNFAVASGEMSPSQFVAFLTQTLGICTSVSRAGAVHFVCMDHRHVGELTAAGESVYGARLNICVWVKSNAGMGSLYRSQHELVFVFRVGDEQHFNAVELGRHGRNRTNVWEYASVNSLKGSRRQDLHLHPTVKPVGLVSDAIMDVTRRGDLVLDAFLGSGTSLIAAERTGRRFRGLELEPGYVDVAIERWSNMTGVEPIHLATGKTFSKLRKTRLGKDEADAE
jgi:hypothetical protein